MAVPAAPSSWGPRWSRLVLGKFFAYVMWHSKVTNRQFVPKRGAVILAGNHTGVIDGPVLAGASPRALHILVKQEMFHGFVGAVLRGAGQIPVDREGGRAALSTARAVLKRGGAVGIFPEGSRGGGQVEGIHGGVAWLALNTGAPVVPVAILGTRRTGEPVGVVPRFRRKLIVQFGPPMEVRRAPGQSGKESLAAANQQIRDGLAELVRQSAAQHNVALPQD